ncbi:hypothetical protein DPEC_G00316900 [Dallia pectoralis]|uniref:Uncharacterized protein n=1 Tax=Dallia pectoralis TaxID=75939 RepID=A0ACC2FCV7_DALPE|nr:hypothetical protein DPEC_G00316900 [Dallia pectoralis]
MHIDKTGCISSGEYREQLTNLFREREREREKERGRFTTTSAKGPGALRAENTVPSDTAGMMERFNNHCATPGYTSHHTQHCPGPQRAFQQKNTHSPQFCFDPVGVRRVWME